MGERLPDSERSLFATVGNFRIAQIIAGRRGDDKYKAGEPVLVYAEPFGFGYGEGADGLYSIGFLVDLRVLSETGDVLGEMPGIANLDLTSRFKNREFQANLTYTLSGVAPGHYVLETTLHDKNSSKTGTFQNTIEIVE